MNKKNLVNDILVNDINESSEAKLSLLKRIKQIKDSIKIIYKALKKGKKILICGNGGSAADAQHLAAEFLVRLRPNINRKPYPIISLAQDTSTITACANDYSFKDLFARNFIALSNSGDVLVSISTSGNSQNILQVLKEAKKKNIKCISFLGKNGGKAKKLSNIPIIVESNNTARIQEAHIFLGHFIFENVENLLIKKK